MRAGKASTLAFNALAIQADSGAIKIAFDFR